MRWVGKSGFALLLTAIMAAEVGGQETSLTIAAGAFAFDLSGTGTAPMAAIRVDRELASSLRLEGAVTVARPKQQFGATTTFLAPEVHVRWSPVRGRVQPYLGGGFGWVVDIRPDTEDRAGVSFSGAVGLRIQTSQEGRAGFVLEFRPRFIDTDFSGSSGDFTLGWFFGL